MSRPCKNTPAGKLATERWRKTMQERYGDITAKMQEMGRKGGKNGKGPDYKGGFGGDRELAKRAGRKGGRISRRKGKYTAILDENKEFIRESVKKNATVQSIADELGIPHKSVRWYIQSRFGGLKNV
jgi:general stress protein YciG